jgi:Fe-S cluster assembly scaffold protein SufB
VEIFVGEGAVITYLSVQESTSDIVIKQRSKVEANAKVHWQNITLGSGSADHQLRSSLTGANAESSIDWVFYAKGKEVQKISAENLFEAREGAGEITLNGVAQDNAQVTCNGLINISRNGSGTNTYLSEDVLMLDSTAKVDAIPGLEINTNDVKASHSATVSKVTDEDLFYFGSRGIARLLARELFVLGFLSHLVNRIPHDDLRDQVLEAVVQKYEGDRCSS